MFGVRKNKLVVFGLLAVPLVALLGFVQMIVRSHESSYCAVCGEPAMLHVIESHASEFWKNKTYGLCGKHAQQFNAANLPKPTNSPTSNQP
jgi:hypothetical protein